MLKGTHPPALTHLDVPVSRYQKRGGGPNLRILLLLKDYPLVFPHLEVIVSENCSTSQIYRRAIHFR